MAIFHGVHWNVPIYREECLIVYINQIYTPTQPARLPYVQLEDTQIIAYMWKWKLNALSQKMWFLLIILQNFIIYVYQLENTLL